MKVSTRAYSSAELVHFRQIIDFSGTTLSPWTSTHATVETFCTVRSFSLRTLVQLSAKIVYIFTLHSLVLMHIIVTDCSLIVLIVPIRIRSHSKIVIFLYTGYTQIIDFFEGKSQNTTRAVCV